MSSLFYHSNENVGVLKTHIYAYRSWLFAHIYTNVEAIYAIQSNCHASLTLSQFNTDNAIRQLVLDILGIAGVDNIAISVTCTWQLALLTNDWRVQRPIAWNRWGQNVVLPVNSARPTSSVSWFVRFGSSAADDARLTLNIVWQLVSTKLHTRCSLRCQQTLGYQQMPKHNEDGHRLDDAITRRYERIWFVVERPLMLVHSIIVI